MYLVFRTETFAKLFFLISCTGLFLYAILAFYTFHTAYTSMSQMQKIQDLTNDLHDLELESTNEARIDNDLKFILFWTQSDHDAANNIMFEGQQIFTDHRCDYANCFLTTNKTMLKGDLTKFDAIVFNISVIKNWKKVNMPQTRSKRQKYIFYSLQASNEVPICNINADNYFNWTWTYKLNSDIVSPFIEVTDLQGNVIAPKLKVHWPDPSYLMDEEINNKRKPKRKTMLWIMDKCNARNKRPAFIRELQAEFKTNLLDFDIYGCGNLPCPEEGCLQEIKKYYFYLVYENSGSEDYVNKDVIMAYKNGAVPVILGRTDYRKFLPDGSYFQAQSMSIDNIAAKIRYIIKNPYLYHSYFSWKKMFSIHETEEFKGLCDLCAYLNDEVKFGRISVYKNFRKWWYPGPLYEKCIPKGAEDLAEVLAYLNSSVHLR